MLSFHQWAGSSGAASRARMIPLSAYLGRQLPDEFLGIHSANLLIVRWQCFYCSSMHFHVCSDVISSGKHSGSFNSPRFTTAY
jgi:hypothetical protein